jgi:hypothetical protein
VLALGTAVVAAPACSKADKSETAASGKTSSSFSGDDLSLLPADADVVLGINAGQILQSALWKQYGDAAKRGGAMSKVKEVQDKCGIDPFASVKKVTVGIRQTEGNQPSGVVVVHGVNKDKGLACIEKLKEPGTEITRDGDLVFIKDRNVTGVLTFVGDETAVMVFGDKANADGVKQVVAGNSGLKSAAWFEPLYSKVKTSDSLWFVVNGKPMAQASSMLGGSPTAAVGSINITDGVSIDGRIAFDSPEVAAKSAEELKAKSQLVATMVDKIDVASEANAVTYSVVVSSQRLQSMISNFGASFGLGK